MTPSGVASNKEAAHSGGFFIAHLDRWF